MSDHIDIREVEDGSGVFQVEVHDHEVKQIDAVGQATEGNKR